MNKIVSPSILACDYSRINEEVLAIKNAGAEYVHIDIMDGKFVPNTSFESRVIKDINVDIVKDVHIMVMDPLNASKEYLDLGADILTFHYEACSNDEEVIKTIELIHSYSKKAGLSIKPCTEVDSIIKFLPLIDLVLVMSVEPGKGGQKFMMEATDKIKQLSSYIKENKLNVLIEVDGGINKETGKLCIDAGVDVLVAGTYIFKAENYKERIDSLKE